MQADLTQSTLLPQEFASTVVICLCGSGDTTGTSPQESDIRLDIAINKPLHRA